MTTTKMVFKYRAYPTRSQAKYIDECIHSCWWFYRYVLHQYEDDYKQAKANYQKEVLSYYDLSVAYHPFWFRREPGKVKIPREFYPLGAPIRHRGFGILSTYKFIQKIRDERPHFQNIPAVVLQEVLERVASAFDKFWKEGCGYPKYPKEKDYKSITWLSTIKIFPEDALLKLIKFPGLLKIVYHRLIKGKIKRATILKDNLGKYYVFLTCEFDNKINRNIVEGSIIGIDMNIKAIDKSLRSFVTLSNGVKIDIPRWYTQYRNKFLKVQKKISKTKFCSKEWVKYNRYLKHIYTDIRNKKDYWIHNFTRELANKYDYVVIEDIDLTRFHKKRETPTKATNMDLASDRCMRKAWMETSFGEFKRQLKYKFGDKLIIVNPAYTSQKCNVCGNKNSNLTLSDREWQCPSCGKVLDRDVNAAMNIRNDGITKIKML
jgi:putative transposase